MANMNLPGGRVISINMSNKSSGGRKTKTVSISFTGKGGGAKKK